MPNWCNNTVEITHKDPAMLERVRSAFKEGTLLNEFIPVPKDLQITAGFLGNTDEQKKLEEQEQANLANHGYKNWYDYCVNEWGTKWDIGGDGCEALDRGTQYGPGLILNFDSAWSPPIGAYEKLCDLGFDIRAYYYEGGMNFAGIWDNGDDDFYDLPSTSAGVREEIPVVLDDMFAISESMEMWEQENQEEENED
jgi:hypothetical protein